MQGERYVGSLLMASLPSNTHACDQGTPYFVAAEVQIGTYMFRPHEAGIKDPFPNDDEQSQEELPALVVPLATPESLPLITPDQAPSPVKGEGLKRRRPRVSDTANGAGFEEFPGQASQTTCQVTSADHEQHQDPPGQKDQDTTFDPDPFTYNPMHDFEALIWIGNYFIFNRRVIGHSQQQPQDDLVAQAAYARRLFSGGAHEKYMVFDELRGKVVTTFARHVKRLHPALHEIGQQMEAWLRTVKAIYISLERGDCPTLASSKNVLDLKKRLAPFPAKIMQILANEDIEVVDLPSDAKEVVQVQASADSAVEDSTIVTKSEGSDRPARKRRDLRPHPGVLE